ncbi:MAG: hypothetical protein AB7P69_26855 [Candidatus Binatia bacterium]
MAALPVERAALSAPKVDATDLVARAFLRGPDPSARRPDGGPVQIRIGRRRARSRRHHCCSPTMSNAASPYATTRPMPIKAAAPIAIARTMLMRNRAPQVHERSFRAQFGNCFARLQDA